MERQAAEYEAALARAHQEREAAQQQAAAAEERAKLAAATPARGWAQDHAALKRFAECNPGAIITRVFLPYEDVEMPGHFRTSGFTAVIEQGAEGPARFVTTEGQEVTL